MTTATKQQEMYQRIEEHGQNLNDIFNTLQCNVELCKKLRQYERKATKLTTQACNGDIPTDYNYETRLKCILNNVNQLLCNVQRKHVPIFINTDPRGYALKIEDEYVRENNLKIDKDLGGYGIIAPDLSRG